MILLMVASVDSSNYTSPTHTCTHTRMHVIPYTHTHSWTYTHGLPPRGFSKTHLFALSTMQCKRASAGFSLTRMFLQC